MASTAFNSRSMVLLKLEVAKLRNLAPGSLTLYSRSCELPAYGEASLMASMQTCPLVWSGERKARHVEAMRRARLCCHLLGAMIMQTTTWSICTATWKFSTMQQLRGVLLLAWMTCASSMRDIISSGTSVSRVVGGTPCCDIVCQILLLVMWWYLRQNCWSLLIKGMILARWQIVLGLVLLCIVWCCWQTRTTRKAVVCWPPLAGYLHPPTAIPEPAPVHHTPCGDQHWDASSCRGYYRYDCKGILWEMLLIRL